MEKKGIRATTAAIFIPDTNTEQLHDEYLKNNSKLSCGIIMILGCEIKYLDVSAIPVKQ